MRKDINISEVAKQAGVSIATVSRVFNGSGPVKESTRKKIADIIESTGYRPNVLARELADKKTHVVGLIVHSMVGEGIPRAINGVSHALDQAGYNLFISCSDGNFEKEMKHFELFRLKRVDGIIFATRKFRKEHESWIKSLPIPVVVLLQDTEQYHIPYVAFDNRRFAKEVTEELLRRGHKDIVFLGGPGDSVNASERERGFNDALEQRGISNSPMFVSHGDYHIEDGYNEMSDILTKSKDFSAVVAINDGKAIGALNSLLDHGIKVPEDVSVIGLDDTVLAKATRLKLSGVNYSYSALGSEGADLLLEQIEKKEVFFEKRIIPFNIHIRDTVTNFKKLK